MCRIYNFKLTVLRLQIAMNVNLNIKTIYILRKITRYFRVWQFVLCIIYMCLYIMDCIKKKKTYVMMH